MTPPLLFLPGHMCDERAWAPVAERLAAAGYAGSHAGLDRDDRIDAMAARVLAETEGAFIAIGFSMGAITALALHRAAPERVAGLCLVGINAGADLPERSGARIGQQRLVRAGELEAVAREQLLPHYFAQGCTDTARLGELCVDMALAVGPEAFVRQSEALRTRPDGKPGLAAIACPTLLVSAEEDRLCPPAWHEATTAAIAGAELARVTGAGHMAPIETPEAVAAPILAWLRHYWPETDHA